VTFVFYCEYNRVTPNAIVSGGFHDSRYVIARRCQCSRILLSSQACHADQQREMKTLEIEVGIILIDSSRLAEIPLTYDWPSSTKHPQIINAAVVSEI